MKLHKEGKKTILLQILFFSLINYLAFNYASNTTIYLIGIISSIIIIITLNFFRIPLRKYERKEGIVYAPCDGKIVVIEETTENEFFKDKRIQVSIFMSPLNVHNQLYPVNGTVKYVKYHPGKFLVAWDPKASNNNERSTIVIQNKKITVLARQIAGALARRIITYSNVNDKVNSCDEYGFIKFGSRVDIFLPLGTDIQTKLNQKVKGGQSIIATY